MATELLSAMEDIIIKLLERELQAQGITEQLKAENALEWIGRMNNITYGRVQWRLFFQNLFSIMFYIEMF